MRICGTILTLLIIQVSVFANDSTSVLTEEQFMRYVKSYHPVAVQAKLLSRQADISIRNARGNFDPIIEADYSQKDFNNDNYYKILSSGLRIPTWYGIEVKMGYEQNRGLYLNPENTLPANGLWYLGVSVPISRGLIIDSRRAALKKANIYAESTTEEQKLLLNNLLFEAIKQYWSWVETWNKFKVYEESLSLAREQLEAVKQSFSFGDMPAIDTLEAFIQVQNRIASRDQSRLDYIKNTFNLSNYLWYENNTPLEITEDLRPPLYQDVEVENSLLYNSTLENLEAQLNEQHPELQLIRYNLASLGVDRKLMAEQLKPKLNLNFNGLNEPVNSEIINNYNPENYQWGLQFSFPLFLRKERAQLQLTKLRIQQETIQQSQKRLFLTNNLRQISNEITILSDQISLSNETVVNYNRLLQAEIRKFAMGESSLFLINSRDVSYVNSKLKYIELLKKVKTAESGLYWAAGLLHEL